MKKMIMMFFIIFILILQSCMAKNTYDENDDDYNLLWENLLGNANNVGLVMSSMTDIGDITPFKTHEEVDDFNTAPCTYVEGDSIYIIRNFPENLPENIYTFLENNDLKKEIEIYSISNISAGSVKIELKDIQEKRIVFYTLTYNKTDKKYYITGLESINGEYIPTLYIFDNEGKLQDNMTLANINLSNIIVDDKNIYYLYEKIMNNIKSYDLMKYSIKDSAASIVADSISVFFGGADAIYYIKNETTASFDINTILYRYDTEKGTITSVSEITENYNILNACFDKINDNLYVSEGTKIYAYSIKDKKSVKVMESLQEYMHIKQISQSNMLIGIGHNQITVYETASKPVSIDNDEKLLKICYMSSQPGSAPLQFYYPLKYMKFNGTYVILEEAYTAKDFMEYMNTMAKKLLSGDDDFDLFVVHTSMFDILKENYYVDFSLFPALEKRFDSMLPGIKELCSINGKLCLYPEYISFNMMQCNNAMVNEIYEIPETFNEMPLFKDNVVGSFSNTSSLFMSSFFYHTLVMPWFSQYASNFMEGNTDIDNTDILKALISTSMSLIQDSSVYIGNDQVDSYINIIQNQSMSNSARSESESIYPLPKVDASFKYSADALYIAINPNSKNKQLAANFLAYVNDYTASLYAEQGFTILYENDKTASHGHEHEQNNNTEIVELYKKQLIDSIREYNNSEYSVLLYNQFEQLALGNISVDSMTEQIYRLLKMLRDE